MSVYFITCREAGRVKIGHASNPMRRFEALQTGCPLPLRLESTMRGGRNEERALHRLFAEHRVRGEWFSLHPSIEALIEERKAAQNDKWAGRSRSSRSEKWLSMGRNRGGNHG